VSRSSVRLLNADFDAVSLDGTVDRVFELVDGPDRGWICTVNVAILMTMRTEPQLQRFVDHSACTVADGQPIVWLSKVFRTPLPLRVTGIDLIEHICARAAAQQAGVYLLGASRPVVEEVASRLLLANPDLQLTFDDGYFSGDEGGARARAVAASGARILIVGMGVPLQERFIEDHWDMLGVDVAIGVGGSFDVLAGLRTRAPRWMQRCGLEWVHRLREEPRRLFGRYVTTGFRFLVLGSRAIVLPRYRRS
jgi:N-acetylglucosaminyldiphosphoundecaprenol N-acetyl-beta-D-mannosaminyltransferase